MRGPHCKQCQHNEWYVILLHLNLSLLFVILKSSKFGYMLSLDSQAIKVARLYFLKKFREATFE